MDRVWNVVLLDCREHIPGGCDVVSNKRLERGCADLRLQHHDHVSAREMLLPFARFCEVGVYRRHVRMRLSKDVQIRTKLVEHDQVVVSLCLQACNEVLADKAGAARNHDAGLLHALARKKRRMGCEIGSMIPGAMSGSSALAVPAPCQGVAAVTVLLSAN